MDASAAGSVPDVRPLAKLLLVLNLVVSTQGFLFAQGMFALRRDYVAAQLCVFRDVPESDCHGRCFLEKVQEQQRRDQERTEKGLDVVLASTWLPAPEQTALVTPERPAEPPPALVPAPIHGQDAPMGVFHPPRMA